jgi:tetratricopeptide (TPR) repeat protein
MKKLIMLLVILYSVQLLPAQNIEADSLKKVLLTIEESPKRVLVLEGISYAYLSSFPDTAMQYALKGLQLAEKINDRIGKAYCTNALGNVYYSVGDYPKALQMYLQSLEMKERLDNQKHAIAVTYFNIANVYTDQKDYGHALSYLFKAKKVDEEAKDSVSIMFDFYSLGTIYHRMNKADSALFYINQAYKIANKAEDKNLIGAILNTLGEIYASLNNFQLAAKYHNQSIPFSEAVKDYEVLSANYHGLAKLAKQRGLLDSSIFYSQKALSFAQEAPFLKQILENSKMLVEVFKTKNQFDSAFKYLELTIATKDSLFNVENVNKVQNLKLSEQQRQHAIETE